MYTIFNDEAVSELLNSVGLDAVLRGQLTNSLISPHPKFLSRHTLTALCSLEPSILTCSNFLVSISHFSRSQKKCCSSTQPSMYLSTFLVPRLLSLISSFNRFQSSSISFSSSLALIIPSTSLPHHHAFLPSSCSSFSLLPDLSYRSSATYSNAYGPL